MSKLGAALMTVAALASAVPAIPASAAEAPHRISHSPAWGCRDKGELYNLLFLAISNSYETQLAAALADGRCVTFAPGESVAVIDEGSRGIVKVERGGIAQVSTRPSGYWTLARNVD